MWLGYDFLSACRGWQAAGSPPHRSQRPRAGRGHGHHYPQRNALRPQPGRQIPPCNRPGGRERHGGWSPLPAKSVRVRTWLGRLVCELRPEGSARKRNARLMSYPIKSPRKLIEVALPLDIINAESLRRKQKAPKGWPTSFHKWWAQRPLAAARAVIFGQLVNDPSWRWELENPGKIPPNHLKANWAKNRKGLFNIIGDLITCEHSANHEVFEQARFKIHRSWRELCDLNKD